MRDARERFASLDQRGRVVGVLGALLARTGRRDEARSALEEALAVADEQDLRSLRARAMAELALLAARKPADSVRVLADCESGIDFVERMEIRFLLWKATRDSAHLAAAWRNFQYLVAHAPADCRETMLANVPTHRDIAAAAKEAGL